MYIKTTTVAAIFIFLSINCFGQGHLSSASKARAAKKASAEAKMYSSKGFTAYSSNQSIKSLLTNYYENSFRECSPGERVYISSLGMAKAGSSAAAFQQAMKQTKHRSPACFKCILTAGFRQTNALPKRKNQHLLMPLINREKH